MKLTLLNQSGRAVPRSFLQTWVKRLDQIAAKKIKPSLYRGRELVVVFLNPGSARELNRKYRGKNYATDVLSFSSGSAGDDLLGELAICPEVISRQAAEHGLLVREELGYMVLHGFLHLLGYDHETSERDAKKMFALQDELFEQLLKKPTRSIKRSQSLL